MILFIEGHASTEGEASYNLSLSARRAKQVQKFFISRGVKKGRLIIDFHGEESPLNFNVTDKEKEKNRRVEFDIKYHLYDSSIADDLMNEFDSLLNRINGVNSFFEEKQKINVLQEKQVEANTEVKEQELVEDILPKTIVEEEVIEETVLVDDDVNKYLVVVEVFNDKNNAMEFSSSSDVADLQYIFLNEKYYVYAFASEQRENAETFRDEYQKGCWVLDLK